MEEGWRGGGGGAGEQARTGQAAPQASHDGRADNTAGMLTCHKHLLLEEKILSPQMSSG